MQGSPNMARHQNQAENFQKLEILDPHLTESQSPKDPKISSSV